MGLLIDPEGDQVPNVGVLWLLVGVVVAAEVVGVAEGKLSEWVREDVSGGLTVKVLVLVGGGEIVGLFVLELLR